MADAPERANLIQMHPRTFASVIVSLVVGLGGGAGAAGAITTSSAAALTTEIKLSRAELAGQLGVISQRLSTIERDAGKDRAELTARVERLEAQLAQLAERRR
jgi:DNA-binding XRE family transcriptional regulator